VLEPSCARASGIRANIWTIGRRRRRPGRPDGASRQTVVRVIAPRPVGLFGALLACSAAVAFDRQRRMSTDLIGVFGHFLRWSCLINRRRKPGAHHGKWSCLGIADARRCVLGFFPALHFIRAGGRAFSAFRSRMLPVGASNRARKTWAAAALLSHDAHRRADAVGFWTYFRLLGGFHPPLVWTLMLHTCSRIAPQRRGPPGGAGAFVTFCSVRENSALAAFAVAFAGWRSRFPLVFPRSIFRGFVGGGNFCSRCENRIYPQSIYRRRFRSLRWHDRLCASESTPGRITRVRVCGVVNVRQFRDGVWHRAPARGSALPLTLLAST